MTEKGKNIFVREATGLVKEFSSTDMFMISIGVVMGLSFFAFPLQLWAQYPGGNPILSFGVSAVPILLGATAVFLLGVSMPRSGGSYVWVSRVLSPAMGYIVGWTFIVGASAGVGSVCALSASYLGQSIRVIAVLTKNPALVPLAELTAQPVMLYVILIVCTVAFAIPAFIGRTFFRAFVYVTTITMLMAAVVMPLMLLAAPSSIFPRLWDNFYGGGAYQNVVTIAQQSGWTASRYLTLDMTAVVGGAVSAMLVWSGATHWGTWTAGEVRRPSRSLFAGTLLTTIGCLLLIWLLSFAVVNLTGQQWITQLWVSYPKLSYLMGLPPTIPILVGVVAPVYGPFAMLIAIFFAAIAFYFSLKDIPPAILGMSRAVFGMSFDRMFPEKFSSLSERFHQPTYANTLITAMMLIYGAFALYVGYWVTAGWNAIEISIMNIFVGLALAAFPISRKEIFESAPKFVQKNVGCIPLVSAIGGLSSALWVFILGAAVQQLLAAQNGLTMLLFQALVYFFGGMLVYVYYSVKNAKQKISVQEIYQELPPE